MNILAAAVADFVGLVLIIAMLDSSRIRRSEKRYEFQIFSVIALLSAISCVIDFLVFFSDGKSGAGFKIINMAGNTYSFIANPVFAISWCLFTEFKLYNSMSRVKRIYKYAAIPGAILVIVALINIFVPIIFYIDADNVYHRLPFSYAFYVVELAYLIYSIYIVKKYEERYGKLRFFPLYLMIGPIVLGCFLQTAFYGISLIWVSLSVGLTAIYMAMQNEFSYQDILTGLYNRAYLDYQLEMAAKDSNSHLGGIMIDVDYFKKINDTFGHSVGDEALIDVARVILFSKPDQAVPIRFAGDEFILIIKGTCEENLKKVVNDIRNELKLFNEAEGRQYTLSLSIGYALYDVEKDNTDTFFKKMDDNMYEEKVKKHENGEIR